MVQTRSMKIARLRRQITTDYMDLFSSTSVMSRIYEYDPTFHLVYKKVLSTIRDLNKSIILVRYRGITMEHAKKFNELYYSGFQRYLHEYWESTIYKWMDDCIWARNSQDSRNMHLFRRYLREVFQSLGYCADFHAMLENDTPH